ncbi:Pgm [Acrasis kona]|uniref:Pgm n=1 Tax=Acrasis kona TaxID=1008807 RepID=A0AAW2Z621_9EUKA
MEQQEEELLFALKDFKFGSTNKPRTGKEIISWCSGFLDCDRGHAANVINRVQSHMKQFVSTRKGSVLVRDSDFSSYNINARKRVIILGADEVAVSTAEHLESKFDVVIITDELYGKSTSNALKILEQTRIVTNVTVQHVSTNRLFFEKTSMDSLDSMSFDYLVVCPSVFSQQTSFKTNSSAALLRPRRASHSYIKDIFHTFLPCSLHYKTQSIQTNRHFQISSNASCTEFFSNILVFSPECVIQDKMTSQGRHLGRIINSVDKNHDLPEFLCLPFCPIESKSLKKAGAHVEDFLVLLASKCR